MQTENSHKKDWLWTLPQPVLVFGAMTAVASAHASSATDAWIEPDTLTNLLLLCPIPLLLVAERLVPRRKDWLLRPREFAEDVFWVGCVYLLWVPIYDQHYDTPVSDAFVWLRDASALPIQLEANSALGLIGMALVGIFLAEFIYYWLHRLQHRVMFFWRIHATHHHITKMGVARSDRTHPLEFLALNLGPAVALAFLGASDAVVAVAFTFRIFSAYTNHANVPFRSGWYGKVFTTTEWHQLHHSIDAAESNANFGCAVILWDRLFGTFVGLPGTGKTGPAAVGNGTGKALPVLTQLLMPFYSSRSLKRL